MREKELAHYGAVSLHKAIVYQALDPRLYQALDVPYRMRYQHPLLCLHMWFIVRRFMGEGPEGKAFVQNLYNLWLSDVEYRLQDAGGEKIERRNRGRRRGRGRGKKKKKKERERESYRDMMSEVCVRACMRASRCIHPCIYVYI
jgi:hypothetical protein